MKNEQPAAAPSRGLPAWLDGSTIAIIGAVVGTGLTAAIGLGTMELATRSHIDTRIDDVNTRITNLETSVNRRIDGLEASFNKRFDALAARIDGLDGPRALGGDRRRGNPWPPGSPAPPGASR